MMVGSENVFDSASGRVDPDFLGLSHNGNGVQFGSDSLHYVWTEGSTSFT